LAEAVSKYNPSEQPQTEGTPHIDELRLLSVIQKNSSADYNELALLSKRKARAILRIGNDTLTRLINNGDIKIILINERERIPYVSLQEYVYSMSSKEELESENHEFITVEESVAMANKIIYEINKGA